MSEKFDKVAYNMQYNKANYANINLKVPREVKARWELRAKAAGQSLTAWLSDRAGEQINGWAYTLVKGDIEEAFDSAADYHFRVFGCRTPGEMAAAIKRTGAADPEFYVLENEGDGADTISNFLARFDN